MTKGREWLLSFVDNSIAVDVELFILIVSILSVPVYVNDVGLLLQFIIIFSLFRFMF